MLKAGSKVSGHVLWAKLSLKRRWESDRPARQEHVQPTEGDMWGGHWRLLHPRPPHSAEEIHLDRPFQSVSGKYGRKNDGLCSNSASLFVWGHLQRFYLSNPSRSVCVSPVLKLDSLSVHSWWIKWAANAEKRPTLETYFCWSLSTQDVLTDWIALNLRLFTCFTGLVEQMGSFLPWRNYCI